MKEWEDAGEGVGDGGNGPILPVAVAPDAPMLLLGSVREAADVDRLKELGVGFVLNCAQESQTVPRGADPAAYAAAGVEYLCLNAVDFVTAREWSPLIAEKRYVRDDGVGVRDEFKLSSMASQAMAFIAKAERAGKPVLIHCVEGLKRSAFICAAYLILSKGYYMLPAMEAVFRARRHRNTLGNHHIQNQLMVMSHHVKRLWDDEEAGEAHLPPEGLPAPVLNAPQDALPEDAFPGFPLSPTRLRTPTPRAMVGGNGNGANGVAEQPRELEAHLLSRFDEVESTMAAAPAPEA